jgi:hypothetical protein
MKGRDFISTSLLSMVSESEDPLLLFWPLIKIETQIRIQSADKTGISNKYSSVV